MNIPAFDGYVFDLDGTIYLGDFPLAGAVEAVQILHQRGKKLVFLSNNPTKTREQYVTRLAKLGITAELNQIVNSSFALVRWLQREAPGCKVFAVGEQPLKDELSAAGFVLTEDPTEIQFVIASFDRTFVYRKLQIAFDAIRAGARLIATNPDRYCPVPGGGEPDAASIIAAIEACTTTQCEIVAGKPSPLMVEIVAELLELPLQRCAMVGDRLSTDIAMGKAAGMPTVLPLTGETTREMLTTAIIQPDYVVESLLEMVPSTSR
jgi:NagD protein